MVKRVSRKNKSYMKYSVLFVENDEMLLEVYGHALSDAGFDVGVATNSQEVMQFLAKKPAHLVLLDMILPNESGLEILKEIKEKYTACAVVMFTNLTAKQEHDAAFALGAIGFLEKSQYTPRELAMEVKRLCESRADKSDASLTGEDPLQ